MAGARVAVFGGPGERDAVAPVLESVPEERRIDLVDACPLDVAAACLERCALYVGNDSGLMHLACAAGIPVVGLFGPSREEIYGPRGERCCALRTPERFEDFVARRVWDAKNVSGLLDSIPVERVADAAARLLVPAPSCGRALEALCPPGEAGLKCAP